MRKSFIKKSIFTIMIFSLLIIFGCEDNGTEVEEIIDMDNVDVRLIDSWDLYEWHIDSKSASKSKTKVKSNFSEERGEYPILLESIYLVIEKNNIILNGIVFNSNEDDIESLQMIDNQLFIVNTDGDSIYYYDFYHNEDSGALWLIEETTDSSELAFDPTEVPDSVVVNISDYMLFFINQMGPVLELLEPEYNSQVGDLTPDFSWEDTGASEYIFQVRNDTLFNETSGFVFNEILDDNEYEVEDGDALANFSSFYWRVKADNSDWSVVWNFGTYDVITLSSPTNTARVCRKPTLAWNEYEGADDYYLMVSKDSGFNSDIVVDEPALTGTEYVYSDYFEDGERYYWKVRANNVQNYWSETRYFIISQSVSLTNPSDGAFEIVTPVVFTWGALQNASNYHIQVASDSTFETIIVEDDNLTDITFTEAGNLDENAEYYWRINSDVATVWSDFSSFMTNNVILLYSPEDEAEEVGTLVKFEWRVFDAVDEYFLQVSENNSFSSIVVNEVVESDAEEFANYTPVFDFNPVTEYFWRASHDSLAWSDTWSFNTAAISGAPMNPTPEDGAEEIFQLLTLEWEGGASTTIYHVQLSDSDSFNNLIVDIVTTNESYGLTEEEDEMLSLGTNYYWKVKGNFCEWSDVWEFETRTNKPDNVEVVVNNATPNKLDMSWDCASGNYTSFKIERSEDGNIWEDIGSTESTIYNYVDLNLADNTLYYYRVSSVNPVGVSEPSESAFTTTGQFTLQNNPEMITVTAGTFSMGSDAGEEDESPVHNVTLSNTFEIGKFEVTNAQYCELLNWAFGKGKIQGILDDGLNYAADAVNYTVILEDFEDGNIQISFNNDDNIFEVENGNINYPINGVKWQGAAIYSNWLSEVNSLTPLYDDVWDSVVYGTSGYRLPTEAEWEFVAIGGNNSNGYNYSGSNVIEEVAQYILNADEIMAVGGLADNELGTYDMSGNVWEWCNDEEYDYTAGAVTDPDNHGGTTLGTERVIIRGGSWEFGEYYLRNTNRSSCRANLTYGRVNTSIGFRVLKIN